VAIGCQLSVIYLCGSSEFCIVRTHHVLLGIDRLVRPFSSMCYSMLGADGMPFLIACAFGLLV
jgi:hypothetical protein